MHNAVAYLFHVNGERARIRGESNQPLTRRSGKPSGPRKYGCPLCVMRLPRGRQYVDMTR